MLEVGAGLGFLTRSIASKCQKVMAVESDPRLIQVLRDQLENVSNIRIVEGNVLKIDVPPFSKVISIPPYHISSRLIEWLFKREFDRAVLVFQREFANHLVASVGSEDYSWLTVAVYYYLEVELLDKAPKRIFYPQPEVDSTIVLLRRKTQHPFPLKAEAAYVRLVQSLFRNRNKKIRNAALPFLKGICGLPGEEAVREADALPYSGKRARELAPEDFGALANAINR